MDLQVTSVDVSQALRDQLPPLVVFPREDPDVWLLPGRLHMGSAELPPSTAYLCVEGDVVQVELHGYRVRNDDAGLIGASMLLLQALYQQLGTLQPQQVLVFLGPLEAMQVPDGEPLPEYNRRLWAGIAVRCEDGYRS